MDIAEILGGVFLLLIGVLCVVPLPLDGGFIWFPLDDSVAVIVILVAGGCIILGIYFIVAGFRSEKKSPMREVVGGVCLLFSFLICFAGLAAENETWTTVFLFLGVGFLIMGVVLVGVRKVGKKVHAYITHACIKSTTSLNSYLGTAKKEQQKAIEFMNQKYE